ncbi:MAG: 2-oxoglutarate dehydrogenase E1 component [Spirochaetota bacterium]
MNIQHLMALNGDNAKLLEEIYQKYKENPANVTGDWAIFFHQLENEGNPPSNGTAGASIVPATGSPSYKTPPSGPQMGGKLSLSAMGVLNILNAYRRQGHLAANLDPLGINQPNRSFIETKLRELSQEDLDMIVDERTSGPGLGAVPLKEVLQWYEQTYCGSIGSEQYYLVDDEEREWLQIKMETTANSEPVSHNTRLRLFRKLFEADYFENFLARKYVGKKRFSLEGGETFIPMMDTLVQEAGRSELEHIVMGMAHRGRLNVLVNIIDKPASQIFAEFEENVDTSLDYADVKYHLRYSNTLKTESGREVKLSLAFNPSHLEAVNPVVTGSVRARQLLKNDTNRTRFMPLLIHGDAAFAGQGVVSETLNLMNLEGYDVGGTFHVVVNNQIGFTTLPNESRSTLYATDLAKGFQIPIFHVNGDDPEAAYRTMKLCLEYRQKFHKDVIIDLICYRRLGHNETDEPAFTQPYMYNIIKKHPKVINSYEKFLLEHTDVNKSELENIKKEAKEYLEDSFNETKKQKIKIKVDTMKGVWANYSKDPLDSQPATQILAEQEEKILHAITNTPDNFTPNSKLVKLLDTRKKMGKGEIPIDWGFAEAMSFGSILENGFHIRVSGQDSQRGTFSHRHAVLVDSNNGETYIPLNHISEKQGLFEIVNASLSEYSVLGFEYGYSLSDPSALVIWEAQFGDFANTAQVIFDQFISSSEVKWQRFSGLVVLLPHGYEGQGPEHSSARLERMLQLCANDNIQVCNCTTPAQYFHLLRRQILRSYRKPLMIMSPKSLLRHPKATSALDELMKKAFQEVLDDAEAAKAAKKVKRVLFCSGKVYYDLLEEKEKGKRSDVAIIRIEQLYPFPLERTKELIEQYKTANELYWVQEEPHNQGAWFFIKDIFDEMYKTRNALTFIGRKEYPSPAAGHVKVHQRQQKEVVELAFQ